MSLSGSAAEDFQKTGDGVLHYDNEPKAPEATRENPGAVYGGPAEAGTMPGSGTPDHHGDVRGVFSNPLKAREVFSDLSTAFTTAINAVKDESGSGIGNVGKALIAKLESMRDEVDGWSAGRGLPEAGSTDKTSEVERVGDGGLYRD